MSPIILFFLFPINGHVIVWVAYYSLYSSFCILQVQINRKKWSKANSCLLRHNTVNGLGTNRCRIGHRIVKLKVFITCPEIISHSWPTRVFPSLHHLLLYCTLYNSTCTKVAYYSHSSGKMCLLFSHQIESLLCLNLCWHNLPGLLGGPKCPPVFEIRPIAVQCYFAYQVNCVRLDVHNISNMSIAYNILWIQHAIMQCMCKLPCVHAQHMSYTSMKCPPYMQLAIIHTHPTRPACHSMCMHNIYTVVPLELCPHGQAHALLC